MISVLVLACGLSALAAYQFGAFESRQVAVSGNDSKDDVDPDRAGLGVTAQDVVSAFRDPEFGYSFQRIKETRKGERRLLGTSPNKMVYLEMIGDPELTKVSAFAGFPGDDKAAALKNALHLYSLVAVVFPEWHGSSDWMSTAFDRLSEDGTQEFTTVQGEATINISRLDDLLPGTVLLTIETESRDD